MESEFGALIDILERLNRTAMRLVRVVWPDCALVDHSVEETLTIEQEELKRRPVQVGDHDRDDQHADVIEPKSVDLGVETVKELGDKWDPRRSKVQAGKDVDETVVDVGDIEDGEHDEEGFLGQ